MTREVKGGEADSAQSENCRSRSLCTEENVSIFVVRLVRLFSREMGQDLVETDLKCILRGM